jgi:hypothetical protein
MGLVQDLSLDALSDKAPPEQKVGFIVAHSKPINWVGGFKHNFSKWFGDLLAAALRYRKNEKRRLS